MTDGIAKLAVKFAAAARIRGAALEAGDVKKANRYFANGEGVLQTLRRHGEAGCRALGALLEDDDEYVISRAAASLLGSGLERKARRVLRRIAESSKSPFLTINADMTIREWDAGRLKRSWGRKAAKKKPRRQA